VDYFWSAALFRRFLFFLGSRERKKEAEERRTPKKGPRTMDALRDVLEQVRSGQLSVEMAWQRLRPTTAEADLGFAHVDLHRQQRCGFPEVIFCEGKTCAWVEEVV